MSVTISNRWQRLGLSPGDERGGFDVLVQNEAAAVTELCIYRDDWDQHAMRGSGLMHCVGITLLGHLQYPHPFGDVTTFTRLGVEIGQDYFFGEWRDAYDYFGEIIHRDQCRQRLPWMDSFRDALLCATCVGKEEDVCRIADWPDTDLEHDEGAWNLAPEDTSYHIVLAYYLRGSTAEKSKSLKAAIRSGKRRRPKLLLDIFECIESSNAEGFAKAITTYLTYFKRQEFDPTPIKYCVSIEGSILWNLAYRQGIDLPELPIELADLVVTPDTLRPMDS